MRTSDDGERTVSRRRLLQVILKREARPKVKLLLFQWS